MISVELSRRFKKIVREAGREEEVSAALKLLIEGFGNPHAHSGLAIRKLGKRFFICLIAFCVMAFRVTGGPG